MRSKSPNNNSLSLGESVSGAIVELNGFVGKIIGEESPDVPIVKFPITNPDGSKGVVLTTIHRKFLKVVHNGKDKPNTT